jgi:divinyl chlorophyllide a 8-vinyl-reductase
VGSRVLLAGGTGYIGRAVAAELAGRGYEVVAVIRRRPDDAGLRLTAGRPGSVSLRLVEATDAKALAAAVAGQRFDAVVSCIASRNGLPQDAWRVDYQANLNLLNAARATGAAHFQLLSALCLQKPRLEFQRAKLAFEAELVRSGLDYTIVRPTAFFKSLAGQVSRVRAGKPFLLFGDGTATACKPIGEADLARYMAECLQDPKRLNRILPIGGPGPAVTPKDQGELLFELTGLPPKFRRVSPRIFDAALFLLAPLGRLAPGLAAKAELARIGRYYATESMLVWNAERQAYDASGTPEYGSETLRDFYRRALDEGLAGQELGDHKLFK